MNEPRCNGAGEMPGQEGKDSCDDNYIEWIEQNKQRLLEAYKEEMDFNDVPDDWLQNKYESELE